MKRATMSFSKKRQALLRAATAKSGSAGVAKSIHFANEDVPEFLRELKRFIKESNKVRIWAK